MKTKRLFRTGLPLTLKNNSLVNVVEEKYVLVRLKDENTGKLLYYDRKVLGQKDKDRGFDI